MRICVALVLASCNIPAPGLAQDRWLPLVLVGDPERRAEVEQALGTVAVDGFDVQLTPPPQPSEPGADTRVEDAVSRARNLYVNEGDFVGCLEQLPDAMIDEALGRRDTLAASRVLLWRAACAIAAGDTVRASEAAAQFASLGLSRPPDIEAVSPEVDRLLSEAAEGLRNRPRVELRIASRVRGARVTVNGHTRRTLPATLRLAPGTHVLRLEAPGAMPETRRVLLREAQALVFRPAPAPPELAAVQWVERFGEGPGALSLTSVALLARALSAPRVVLIEAEETAEGVALRAVLGVQQRTGAAQGRFVIGARASAELRDGDPEAAQDLVRDLLVGAHLVEEAPPLRRRPVFWLAVGVAVAGSVLLGALLARDPRHETDVVLR